MNISQLGIVTNAVLQNSQSRVAEVDRVKHEQSVKARETEVAQQAEQAEGIGVTHEEAAAGDRDADGRRLWEFPESPAGSYGTP